METKVIIHKQYQQLLEQILFFDYTAILLVLHKEALDLYQQESRNSKKLQFAWFLSLHVQSLIIDAINYTTGSPYTYVIQTKSLLCVLAL